MKAQRSRTAKSKATPEVVPFREPSPEPGRQIHHDEIARLAYSYWEARGGGGGSAEDDWARAEEELRRRAEPPPAVKASAAG